MAPDREVVERQSRTGDVGLAPESRTARAGSGRLKSIGAAIQIAAFEAGGEKETIGRRVGTMTEREDREAMAETEVEVVLGRGELVGSYPQGARIGRSPREGLGTRRGRFDVDAIRASDASFVARRRRCRRRLLRVGGFEDGGGMREEARELGPRPGKTSQGKRLAPALQLQAVQETGWITGLGADHCEAHPRTTNANFEGHAARATREPLNRCSAERNWHARPPPGKGGGRKYEQN